MNSDTTYEHVPLLGTTIKTRYRYNGHLPARALTNEQLDALSPNDRHEVLKAKKWLKLQQTKRGREYLRTQKQWRNYQGI